jgi:hypothetical protein
MFEKLSEDEKLFQLEFFHHNDILTLLGNQQQLSAGRGMAFSISEYPLKSIKRCKKVDSFL